MASFRIDINGELKVFVFEEELQAIPLSHSQQTNINKRPVGKLVNKELYWNVSASSAPLLTHLLS